MVKRQGKVIILDDDDVDVVVTVRPSRVAIAIIIIVLLFEALLFGVGFVFADSVKCNLLWCTFTYTSGSSTTITSSEINIQTKCTKNGVIIDCKEMTGGR